MSVIDQLMGLLAPHECLGCAAEGSLLCPGCANALPAATVPQPYGGHLDLVRSATLYRGVAKGLVWKLKSDGAQAAAQAMARQMVSLVPDRKDLLIVHIPTATGRVRLRGYDQSKLLARALSRLARFPYCDVLARHGQAHQVGAHRRERLTQLAGALRVRKPRLVRGAHVILVDDVTTTGATLEAAAAVLKRAGARSVEAVTFAYAPKHS